MNTLPLPGAAEPMQVQALHPVQPPQLQAVPLAVRPPAAGEVLLQVKATSVNPIDVKRAGGHGRRLLGLKGAGRFPLTLGNDVLGRVQAVGASVRHLAVGDRVLGVKPMGPGGTHAQAVTLPAAQLRRLPAGVPLDAAVLPYTWLTAQRALADAGLHARSAAGRRVLVHGATGGLGQLALGQLRRWGAEVTAIGSAAGLARCRELGAQALVDRHQPHWRDLPGAPSAFDATLNFAIWADEPWLLGRLRPGALGHATTVHPLLAHIDDHGFVGGLWRVLRDRRAHAALARRHGGPACRHAWTVFGPDAAALDALLQALADPQVAPSLALPVQRFDGLAQAEAAFAHVAAGRPARALWVIDPEAAR